MADQKQKQNEKELRQEKEEEEEEVLPKPKVYTIGLPALAESLKRDLSSFQAQPEFEEDCLGFLVCYTDETKYLSKDLEFASEELSRFHSLQDKPVFVWLGFDLGPYRKYIFDKLELKERGCVCGYGVGEGEVLPLIDRFFRENLENSLKPAKREK